MRSFERLHRLISEEAGSSLVEFAASAILLFTMLFGIMDCARAMYVDHFVANAAREATRYAAVRGDTWDGTSCATPATFTCEATTANVTSFVQSIASAGIKTANLTVTTTWTGNTANGSVCTNGGAASNSPGCVVIVKVVYSFSFVLPFLPKTVYSIPATAQASIEQ